MNSRIVAYLEFSFKGEHYTPAIELDLDALLERRGHIPDLYPVIAQASGIDPYSYEYEMMEAEEVRFRQAEGLAAEYFDGEHFDIAGFERRWHDERLLVPLQAIAQRVLGIDELSAHPELRTALTEAYRLGQALAQPAEPDS